MRVDGGFQLRVYDGGLCFITPKGRAARIASRIQEWKHAGYWLDPADYLSILCKSESEHAFCVLFMAEREIIKGKHWNKQRSHSQGYEKKWKFVLIKWNAPCVGGLQKVLLKCITT